MLKWHLGTDENYSRVLPISRAIDAAEITILSLPLGATISVVADCRQPDGSPADGYISLRRDDRSLIGSFVKLNNGTRTTVTSETDQVRSIRIDFGAEVAVHSISIFSENCELAGIGEVASLHRTGRTEIVNVGQVSHATREIVESLRKKRVAPSVLAAVEQSMELLPDIRPESFASLIAEVLPLLQSREPLLFLLDLLAIANRDVAEVRRLVIARIVLVELSQQQWLATKSIRFLKKYLSTKTEINALLDSINAQSEQDGIVRQYVISKHTINRSWLLEKRERYLEAIGTVTSSLQERGLLIVLCYGTLLGAMRNQEFIPHDDDVDLLYWDGSQSRDQMIAGMDSLSRSLDATSIKVRPRGSNRHLTVDVNGAGCDLFPCWVEDGLVHLLMENYDLRGIPEKIIFGAPPRMLRLYDRHFPGPPHPEAFLTERYGSNWRTPDRFFEWPWHLNSNDEIDSADLS